MKTITRFFGQLDTTTKFRIVLPRGRYRRFVLFNFGTGSSTTWYIKFPASWFLDPNLKIWQVSVGVHDQIIINAPATAYVNPILDVQLNQLSDDSTDSIEIWAVIPTGPRGMVQIDYDPIP